MTRRLICSLAILSLLAIPAFADNVIYSGADLWMTGQTYTNFKLDPLPADFFCPGSEPFAGQINLEGIPLATEPECILGGIDTVIHRLENAAFNDEGNTQTLIQFLALSLAGVEPLEIAGCGTYDVTTHLDGEQPVTTMRITKTNENGGSFMAPLELNVKMAFTPQDGGKALEVYRNIKLGPGSNSVWSEMDLPEEYVRVKVDTDGDQVADTMLPAPSNFAAGNIIPGNYMPAAAISNVQCVTNLPRMIKCPNNEKPEISCHCTPWSDAPNPWSGTANCEVVDANGNTYCHLHCTYYCPSQWEPPPDIEIIDEGIIQEIG